MGRDCRQLYLLIQVLNVFKHDPEYEVNEEKYGSIKKELLDEDSDDDDSSGSGSGSGSDSDEDDEKKQVSCKYHFPTYSSQSRVVGPKRQQNWTEFFEQTNFWQISS